MKALCIRQPYADGVVFGEKTIEVRTWPTDHRGELLITSAVKPTLDGYPCGYLLGAVEVVDCRPMQPEDAAAAFCDYAPGLYAWVLSNPRCLHECPPVTSRQGLFDLAVELRDLPLIDGRQYTGPSDPPVPPA